MGNNITSTNNNTSANKQAPYKKNNSKVQTTNIDNTKSFSATIQQPPNTCSNNLEPTAYVVSRPNKHMVQFDQVARKAEFDTAILIKGTQNKFKQLSFPSTFYFLHFIFCS